MRASSRAPHGLFRTLAFFAATCAAACTSGSSTPPAQPGPVGNPLGTCSGDAATCIHGTVATRGFNVAFQSAKVDLFAVYPYGKSTPVAEAAVASGGNFAFSNVDAQGRYYLQAIAKFSGAAGDFAVASVVGPITLPATDSVDVKIRPVFLEALEQRPTGAALALSWASAHVYDPGSAKELTDAQVTLTAGAAPVDMPYGTNLSGQKSYFVQLPNGATAPTALQIGVAHATFPGGATFNLAATAPDFDPQVSAPLDQTQISVGQPLDVVWAQEPRAAYAIVELFAGSAGSFDAKYASDAPRGPSVTKETIPGSAIAAPGAYLLNVQMSRPTCPATADGCVYNASTAAINLTAK